MHVGRGEKIRMHTHTHTYIHTYIHACIHAYTYAFTYLGSRSSRCVAQCSERAGSCTVAAEASPALAMADRRTRMVMVT